MKRPDKKTIRAAIRRIDRQNIYEVYQILDPVSEQLDFIITSFCIMLPWGDPYTDYPISKDVIFGVLLTEDYAFILCRNGVLHVFGCIEKEHWLFYVKPWRMWLKMIYNWCRSRYNECIWWIWWYCT